MIKFYLNKLFVSIYRNKTEKKKKKKKKPLHKLKITYA